jgi:hypothetical protein
MLPVILLSVLPLAAAWFWLRRAPGVSALYFLAALGAGILSLSLAAILQMALPAADYGVTRGEAARFVVETALIEEGSRLAALALLFRAFRLLKKAKPECAWAAAAGMTAGLTFAAVESASLAAANPLAAAIRLPSAVILHAACGIRCAAALSLPSINLFSRAGIFIMAVALHSVYNFMAPRGGLFTALAILLALSAFVSSLRRITRTEAD